MGIGINKLVAKGRGLSGIHGMKLDLRDLSVYHFQTIDIHGLGKAIVNDLVHMG